MILTTLAKVAISKAKFYLVIGDLMNVATSLAAQFETLTVQELIVNYPDLLNPYLCYLKVSDPCRYQQALVYLQGAIPESSKSHNSGLPGASQ